MENTDRNLTKHYGCIGKKDRDAILGQRGCVVWFTGLSGSGKSTIAREVESQLAGAGRLVYVLDGDNVRCGLNSDLGFSPEDRRENIRRLGEIAALFADAGIITLAAFISPYRTDRAEARGKVPEGSFIETYIATSLEKCMERDPKGLYQKAKNGEIESMTGIDAPYEEPDNPELTVTPGDETPEQSAKTVIEYLDTNGFLSYRQGGDN